MGNETGQDMPIFRKGAILRADDLTALARKIPGRVVSGPGIGVQAVGRDLVIRATREMPRWVKKDSVWRVDTVGQDVLYCTLLDINWVATPTTGVICKPIDLKRSSFDDLTIGTRTYNYTGTQTRTTTGSSPDENHEIIPPYDAGVSKIVVRALANGYGPILDVGVVLVGYDTNNSGRAFTVVAV